MTAKRFCDYCGALLKPQDGKLVCECAPFKKHTSDATIKETFTKKPERRIADSEVDPLAVYDHECSECGFKKAQIMSKGVQYTDEDEEVEFICGKCGHHDTADGLKIK